MSGIPSHDPVAPAHISFARHGNGPERVLVMHDWNGDHSNDDPILPYLDTQAFTYAFVDLRGYGSSQHIEGKYTLEEISRDCLSVADALGWQRFHVIGHSMTGMATQRIALDARDRIKSAIAICPMSAAGSPAAAEALEFFRSTTEDDVAFCRLIKYVSGNLSLQWAQYKLRQNRQTVSAKCRAGYLDMFAKTNFVAEARGLETPFLVVVGDHDPGIDEAAMKATFLAWHPNAELAIISNCGHYPMQECPPYFATIIESHLRKHAG